jgi:hypothetical protein
VAEARDPRDRGVSFVGASTARGCGVSFLWLLACARGFFVSQATRRFAPLPRREQETLLVPILSGENQVLRT